MSWIHNFTDACVENEAPEKFFYWSGLAAISAVLKKNVSLDRHYYRLYPNIYVFLVAASGAKKGIPITYAKSLVSKANNTRIISGRASMPAIVKDLGKAYTVPGAGIVKDAQGFIISGELAAFLVKDPDALTVLTELHNTHEFDEKPWKNQLKGTGTDELRHPCITLLGATNEDHFIDAVPPNAVGGGFIARTFIVLSTELGLLNSLTEKPKQIPNTDELSKHLIELTKTKGEFNWTQAGKHLYDSWYYGYRQEMKHDPTGTRNRMGDQVLKVAMLLAMSESPRQFDLEESYIREALLVCLQCETGMKQVTMGAGKNSLALQTKMVLRELIADPAHQITRQRVLQKYWGEMDGFDLDRIIETLVGSGAIDVTHHGKTTTYILKPQTLDIYTGYKKGIM